MSEIPTPTAVANRGIVLSDEERAEAARIRKGLVRSFSEIGWKPGYVITGRWRVEEPHNLTNSCLKAVAAEFAEKGWELKLTLRRKYWLFGRQVLCFRIGKPVYE